MEFRRFLHGTILIPAMIIRRARTITVRLIGYQPDLGRLFSAWNTIERTRFRLIPAGPTTSLPPRPARRRSPLP